MRTLAFLGMWAKVTLIVVLAVVVEVATLTNFWVFTPVAGVTVLLWLAVTVGMFREWRARATGFTHQVTDFRRERV